MSEKHDKPTTSPVGPALQLSRVFHAPRRLVFEACSQQKHLERWSCPHGFTIPTSDGDFREGGAWHCLMISPRGEPCPVGGVYEKIVPNELIVFTHGWEDEDGKVEHQTRVTLRFEDAGPSQTRLTIEHATFRSEESRDHHRAGWTECLEKLDDLLAEAKIAGGV